MLELFIGKYAYSSLIEQPLSTPRYYHLPLEKDILPEQILTLTEETLFQLYALEDNAVEDIEYIYFVFIIKDKKKISCS